MKEMMETENTGMQIENSSCSFKFPASSVNFSERLNK